MNRLIFLIIGMALVTYLPRLLPMLLFSSIELPSFWKRFLSFIPYTALSALLFPEILFSTESIESAIFGGSIAVILAYYNVKLFVVVSSAIGAVLLWELII